MKGLDLNTTKKDGGNVVITVSGKLILDTVEAFNRELHSLPEDTKEVSIDLSGIKAISSAGIGALVSRSHELLRDGLSVSLVRPAPQVARLLRHTSLDKILKTDD